MSKIFVFGILAIVVVAAGAWIFFSHSMRASQKAAVKDSNTVVAGDASSPTPTPSSTTAPATVTSATLHTNKGDITIEFSTADAPNTVANFIKLARAGFYDGTKFHRVIKNFMIQGGDPLSKDESKAAMWGTGGPGYSFADEIGANNKNNVGTISMANSGPNTNGSQFFINAAPNNFLDDKHTVFGHVTAGLDVVQAIDNVQTGAADRPLEAVVINSITLN